MVFTSSTIPNFLWSTALSCTLPKVSRGVSASVLYDQSSFQHGLPLKASISGLEDRRVAVVRF